jgi:hypothetical protein
MSELIKFGNANLPAAADLSEALRSLSTAVESMSVILKMDKTGHWVYGIDQTEVDKDSLWAVNPCSFIKGYIAWGEGEVLAERMYPIEDKTAPRFEDLDPPPAGAKLGWQRQLGFNLKCISGEDKGVEARHAVTTRGGIPVVAELGVKVGERIKSDPDTPVAIVKLTSSHYQHKAYGRVYTPVFEVVDWMSMNGEPVESVDGSAGDTGRRRRG